MPHYRARIEGLGMEEVDRILREARVGVVTAGDVSNAPNASGTPAEDPELEGVKVSVDASDEADAKSRLEETLPDGCSIEVLG
ncbi:MAG: hypothetical protein ABIZ50_04340 [Solirubrobacterales bacterium]